MNFVLRHPTLNQELRHPEPPVLPGQSALMVSARYRSARVGGDFYDFIEISPGRLLFVLLDIAGKKEEAFHIAATAQDVLRNSGRELLGNQDVNVAEVLTDLLLDVNRAILAAADPAGVPGRFGATRPAQAGRRGRDRPRCGVPAGGRLVGRVLTSARMVSSALITWVCTIHHAIV